MAFPEQSNARSADGGAMWWGYAGPSWTSYCATQGRSFLRQVRAALGLADGAWDTALQFALITRAVELARTEPTAGWTDVATRLRTDMSEQHVSTFSVAFALYVAIYRPTGLLFSAVVVPPGMATPAWGVLPDDDGAIAGPPACWTEIGDQPGVAPQFVPGPDLDRARAESRRGVRLVPGMTLPDLTPLPGGPGGIPDAAVVMIGVAFVATVAAIAWRSKGPA